jgi:hypothetical protein
MDGDWCNQGTDHLLKDRQDAQKKGGRDKIRGTEIYIRLGDRDIEFGDRDTHTVGDRDTHKFG